VTANKRQKKTNHNIYIKRSQIPRMPSMCDFGNYFSGNPIFWSWLMLLLVLYGSLQLEQQARKKQFGICVLCLVYSEIHPNSYQIAARLLPQQNLRISYFRFAQNIEKLL